MARFIYCRNKAVHEILQSYMTSVYCQRHLSEYSHNSDPTSHYDSFHRILQIQLSGVCPPGNINSCSRRILHFQYRNTIPRSSTASTLIHLPIISMTAFRFPVSITRRKLKKIFLTGGYMRLNQKKLTYFTAITIMFAKSGVRGIPLSFRHF